MELRRFLSVAAATAVVGTAVLMTGCGDDSSSASGVTGTNSMTPPKGFWKGLKVNNSRGQSGYTANGGNFSYNENDNVTWNVGLADTQMMSLANGTNPVTWAMIEQEAYNMDNTTQTIGVDELNATSILVASVMGNASLESDDEFDAGSIMEALRQAKDANSSISLTNTAGFVNQVLAGTLDLAALQTILDEMSDQGVDVASTDAATILADYLGNTEFRNNVSANAIAEQDVKAAGLPDVSMTNATRMLYAKNSSVDARGVEMYKSVTGQVVTADDDSVWVLGGTYDYDKTVQNNDTKEAYDIVGLPVMISAWTENSTRVLTVNGTAYTLNMTDTANKQGTVSGGINGAFDITPNGYALRMTPDSGHTGKTVAFEKEANDTGFYAYLMNGLTTAVDYMFTYENRTALNSTGSTNTTRISDATWE